MSKYSKYFDEVISIERETIGALLETLDKGVMDRIVDLLLEVKKNRQRVITAGCGTSGIAAEKISHTLNVVEVPSFFLSPALAPHGGFGAIQKGDIVVLLTKGGNTHEIVEYIPVCRQKGAMTIGVTQNNDSILAKDCDILFNVSVQREPCPWNLIASGSILAVISAWDAIAFTVMQHNGLTKQDFFLTHPGGGAGEKLKVNMINK